MNICRNPETVFKSFENEYNAYQTVRYRLIDDSVILICGLRTFYSIAFDVYYSCVPVFSHFELAKRYINDFSAFSVGREFKDKKDLFLPINPKPEEEEEVIETASKRADFAYEKLEGIKSLDDCLALYEQMYAEESQGGMASSPIRWYLDTLIFKGRFDDCKALLDRALLNNVHWAFNSCGVEFPDDGNWRKYLPINEESAANRFQQILSQVESSCWKRIRVLLEEGRYFELCSEFMQNYQNNKKLLKKIGIQLGEKADEMMKEMMSAAEAYR